MFANINGKVFLFPLNFSAVSCLAGTAAVGSQIRAICSGEPANPSTKSDQLLNSPAASPEIEHHAVWRTWLFIAYSDERWFFVPFLTTSLKHFSLEDWENILFELGSERANSAQGLYNQNPPRAWYAHVRFAVTACPWTAHLARTWTLADTCMRRSRSTRRRASGCMAGPAPRTAGFPGEYGAWLPRVIFQFRAGSPSCNLSVQGVVSHVLSSSSGRGLPTCPKFDWNASSYCLCISVGRGHPRVSSSIESTSPWVTLSDSLGPVRFSCRASRFHRSLARRRGSVVENFHGLFDR